MDNTPSHLNLPKRIHWNELEGNLYRNLNTLETEEREFIPKYLKNVCITKPPLKVINGLGSHFVLNLDAICNCGKLYKEHDCWKEELKRQNNLYKI